MLNKEVTKIDWNKVPKWTRVQVRDCSSEEWKNEYFLSYNKETAQYITTPCSEFSYREGFLEEAYDECRIYKQETIITKEEVYELIVLNPKTGETTYTTDNYYSLEEAKAHIGLYTNEDSEKVIGIRKMTKIVEDIKL